MVRIGLTRGYYNEKITTQAWLTTAENLKGNVDHGIVLSRDTLWEQEDSSNGRTHT